jgi:hypothetical protein
MTIGSAVAMPFSPSIAVPLSAVRPQDTRFRPRAFLHFVHHPFTWSPDPIVERLDAIGHEGSVCRVPGRGRTSAEANPDRCQVDEVRGNLVLAGRDAPDIPLNLLQCAAIRKRSPPSRRRCSGVTLTTIPALMPTA